VEASPGDRPGTGVHGNEPEDRKESDMVDLGGLADKAKNALNSEQGEQRSDQALDKAEQLADEKTGGKYDQQIDKGRDLADERIGQQDAGEPPA
jgi:hypothetical protein